MSPMPRRRVFERGRTWLFTKLMIKMEKKVTSFLAYGFLRIDTSFCLLCITLCLYTKYPDSCMHLQKHIDYIRISYVPEFVALSDVPYLPLGITIGIVDDPSYCFKNYKHVHTIRNTLLFSTACRLSSTSYTNKIYKLPFQNWKPFI